MLCLIRYPPNWHESWSRFPAKLQLEKDTRQVLNKMLIRLLPKMKRDNVTNPLTRHTHGRKICLLNGSQSHKRTHGNLHALLLLKKRKFMICKKASITRNVLLNTNKRHFIGIYSPAQGNRSANAPKYTFLTQFLHKSAACGTAWHQNVHIERRTPPLEHNWRVFALTYESRSILDSPWIFWVRKRKIIVSRHHPNKYCESLWMAGGNVSIT